MIPTRQLTRSDAPRAVSRSTTRTWSSRRQQFPRFQSTSASPGAGGRTLISLPAPSVAWSVPLLPMASTPSRLQGALQASSTRPLWRQTRSTRQLRRSCSKTPPMQTKPSTPSSTLLTRTLPGSRAAELTSMPLSRTGRLFERTTKDEVDEIVKNAYKKLQDLSRAGLSLETASKAYESLLDMFKQIADLSADAISDILDNHPQAKEQFGGSIQQLQDMGRNYGPEAKKQVDETWSQIKDIIAGGFSASNVDKVRKLAEEKLQQVRKLGDDAWKKCLEEAKPYLYKNPKAKELIEQNADALKQGNMKELFDKVRSAVESGDLGGLSKYVYGAVDKAKSKGSDMESSFGLDKYLKMITQDGEIMPKLQKIGQIAEKHKQEGEKLLKETIEELKQVLEKKSKKAQEVVDQAKKESD